MAKQGEIGYLSALGEGGRRHAMNKPYSDELCGQYLARVGQIMDLLPKPPARVLELGCGTGWISIMLAKRGYRVVARDIAPAMIECANEAKDRERLSNVDFGVADYESLPADGTFDGVVFFDSLHHAEDEYAALTRAFEALRDGGVCVVCEPGSGHSETDESRHAMDEFGVSEKDMPPKRVGKLGRAIGYRKTRVYAHAGQLLPLVSGHEYTDRPGVVGWVLSKPSLRPVVALGLMTLLKRRSGVVALTK